VVAIVKRFGEIDGMSRGGLLALELFSTVIPLMVIGYSYMSGFADNASFGTILTEELHLDSEQAARVHALFGTAAVTKSAWNVLGVVGFLVWGIPMAVTVAAMFAAAWRREPFGLGQKMWRGTVWFVMYLSVIVAQYQITWGGDHSRPVRLVLFVCGLVPVWAFWVLSPVLLVRNGARAWRSLLVSGLVGMVIFGVVLALALRIVFPLLLDGWTGFGPVGVAMALLTWCGVEGVAWVVVACTASTVWERHASIDTVLDAQAASDT
jgi:hypothetical protein